MFCTCRRIQTVAVLSGTALLLTLFHTVLVSPIGTEAIAASTECADGIDNDFDGKIDYPQDPQCLSLHDQSEGPTGRGLFLDITDGLKTVAANGHMTYTISLNSDRDAIQNVDVQFFIPHQTNLLSSTNGGRTAGDYVVWRNVSVNPGTTKKLYVDVGIKPRAQQDLLVVGKVYAAGEEATDITRIEGKEGDPNFQNVPALRLSVSDGKAYAQPNEKLTYRIVVDNTHGPSRTYRLRTDLSTFLSYVNASGDPRVDKSIVEWTSQQIEAGEVQEFYLTALVERETPDNMAVQFKVASGPSVAKDTTGIYKGTMNSSISTSISDGLDSATIGENVTYTLVIRNDTNKLATEVDANVALPRYMEFVSAEEGGQWTGKNVHWTGLTVSPHGSRSIRVTGRIRSDAPIGTKLRASGEVKGHVAVDLTNVDTVRRGGGGGIALGFGPVATSSRAPIILRKNADRGEVRPGDTVRYTLYMKNNTNQAFGNLVVQDRMDTNYMQILGGQGGQQSDGRLSWRVPQLAAGQEWTTSYSVRIAPYVPHGATLNNVVSVSGDGIETFSLTERVMTSSTNVITDLPPTGVSFGGIFATLSGLLGMLPTFLQRKRKFVL